MPADSAIARGRKWFVVGGYAVIAAGFLAIGLIPHLEKASAVEAGIASEQAEISSRVAAKRELDDITQKVQLINMQVGNHDRLLPANQDLGPFMEELSKELDSAGMKESSTVRALPSVTLGKSQQLPIEVTGTCTFSQFHDFLVRLEHLPRMSSVSHLSVEADTPMTGKVAVQLTLSIYNTKPGS